MNFEMKFLNLRKKNLNSTNFFNNVEFTQHHVR